MLKYEKYVPELNLPLIVRLTNGTERKAVLCEWAWGFRLIDCTHPLQNTNLPFDYVDSWRYEDERYMQECRFTENTYRRRINQRTVANTCYVPFGITKY